MLKRFQVLLEDWQEEYIKEVAEVYDQSFSEIVRIFLSEGFLHIVHLAHPEYKITPSAKGLFKLTKKIVGRNSTLVEEHKFLSSLYFEARKAVEYRLSKIRSQKKKQRNNKR